VAPIPVRGRRLVMADSVRKNGGRGEERFPNVGKETFERVTLGRPIPRNKKWFSYQKKLHILQ